MGGSIVVRGLGPPLHLRLLPDDEPFPVPIFGGGLAVCRLSDGVAAAQTPPGLTATAELVGRTLTVTVTSLTGNPPPGVTSSLLVDGNPDALTLVSPGVYRRIFASSATAIAYEGALTASNGIGSPASLPFSGTVPANLTAPGAFGDDDWSLAPDDIEAAPEAEAPGAFGDGDWSLAAPGDAPGDTASALLLESGDALLLETGDRLLLEA